MAIENAKQYAITKSRIRTFEEALVIYKSPPENLRFMSQAMIESIESQLEEFKADVAAYEALATPARADTGARDD